MRIGEDATVRAKLAWRVLVMMLIPLVSAAAFEPPAKNGAAHEAKPRRDQSSTQKRRPWSRFFRRNRGTRAAKTRTPPSVVADLFTLPSKPSPASTVDPVLYDIEEIELVDEPSNTARPSEPSAETGFNPPERSEPAPRVGHQATESTPSVFGPPLPPLESRSESSAPNAPFDFVPDEAHEQASTLHEEPIEIVEEVEHEQASTLRDEPESLDTLPAPIMDVERIRPTEPPPFATLLSPDDRDLDDDESESATAETQSESEGDETNSDASMTEDPFVPADVFRPMESEEPTTDPASNVSPTVFELVTVTEPEADSVDDDANGESDAVSAESWDDPEPFIDSEMLQTIPLVAKEDVPDVEQAWETIPVAMSRNPSDAPADVETQVAVSTIPTPLPLPNSLAVTTAPSQAEAPEPAGSPEPAGPAESVSGNGSVLQAVACSSCGKSVLNHSDPFTSAPAGAISGGAIGGATGQFCSSCAAGRYVAVDSAGCPVETCYPGREPCQDYDDRSLPNRFVGILYECLLCQDPYYALTGPHWIPEANAAFFVDHARPRTQSRHRWDAGRNLILPDRNQFFWGLTGLAVKSVNYHDLTTYIETATANGKFSAFIYTPFRSVRPHFSDGSTPTVFRHANFTDLETGTKSLLFDCELFQLGMQFRTYIPSGIFANGLGTGHVSIEPSLLFSVKLAEEFYLEGQVSQWIPFGAIIGGGILHQHYSFNKVLWRLNSDVKLTGTLELNGWAFQGGFYTDPNDSGSFISSSGGRYYSLGSGFRLAFSDQIDFGFAAAFAISDNHWAEQLYRSEMRVMF